MTAPNGQNLASGLRSAVIFGLTSGLPSATGTGAYEGYRVIGPKAYALTIPDVRKITHVGNDRALALDFLPATEGMSAELRVAAQDLPLNAFLSGVKTVDVGNTVFMPVQTDQQGFEPDVALLLYQQTLDAVSKLRNYRVHIIPKAHVVAMPPGMDENAAEMKYAIAPSPSTTHLWGATLTVGSEGATEAGILEGQSSNRPNLVAFKAVGTETEFLFPTDKQALTTGSIVVWDNGTLVDVVDYTPAVTGITFDNYPAAGHIIVAYYEY